MGLLLKHLFLCFQVTGSFVSHPGHATVQTCSHLHPWRGGCRPGSVPHAEHWTDAAHTFPTLSGTAKTRTQDCRRGIQSDGVYVSSLQFVVVSLKDGMFTNANVLFKTKFVDGMSTVTRTALSQSDANVPQKAREKACQKDKRSKQLINWWPALQNTQLCLILEMLRYFCFDMTPYCNKKKCAGLFCLAFNLISCWLWYLVAPFHLSLFNWVSLSSFLLLIYYSRPLLEAIVFIFVLNKY